MDDSFSFSCASSSGSIARPARRRANTHGHTYKEFSLRKGKWTAEEEAYSNKIISLFNKGLLPIAAGTTLRSFLSDKLQCDPMRITKKYSGASCIGKQIFQPSGLQHIQEAMRTNEDELVRLEKEFHLRLGNKYRFPVSATQVNNDYRNGISDRTSTSDDEDEITPTSKRIRDTSFKKTCSMPDLQYGREQSFVKSSLNSAAKVKRQRAISSIDVVKEFGIYDDKDAGELLMQFAYTIKRTSSSHEHMDRLYFESPLDNGLTSSEELNTYLGGECESPNIGLTMDDSDSSVSHQRSPPIKIELKDENINSDSNITALSLDGLVIDNDDEIKEYKSDKSDDDNDDNDNDGVNEGVVIAGNNN